MNILVDILFLRGKNRNMNSLNRIFNHYRQLIILIIAGFLIGIVVGLVEVVFKYGILFVTQLRIDFFPWILFGLPFAGLFIVYIFKNWASSAKEGIDLVFGIDQKQIDKLPLRIIPSMMLACWLSHLFGASTGRAGVSVQIGAAISHAFGRYFKCSEETTMIFLVAGIAAGFAGLFQAPIAAVFFSMEVLVAGALRYKAMGCTIVSAFVSSYVNDFCGLKRNIYSFNLIVNMDLFFMFKLVFLGVLFGLAGGLFAWSLKHFKNWINNMIKDEYLRIFLGSMVLVFLTFFLFQGRYAGSGENIIKEIMAGNSIYFFDFIFKFVLTILTMSLGFKGGEVTPLFAIGASFGFVLASFFDMPVVLVASLGYVAVFAGGTNTYLAPIALGLELFGSQYFPLYFIVCSVSYLVNWNQSIYLLQKRAE